jgi:hypothetical protein
MEYPAGIYRRIRQQHHAGQCELQRGGNGNQSVSNSGNDFASFLLGVASGGGFRYPDDTAFHCLIMRDYAWFAQDDFKVSPKLTVNFGLRYEIPVPNEERHHHNSSFSPTCPATAFGGIPGAMVYAGVNGAPEHFGDTRMNAFGPRLGVAY